ncbi:hypothetical protein BC829DRAFT_414466 [Chytridium lagenaria]|nr:hypothetical protein BC829DRAFT_414466 [Chytridium lagenaria]
MFPGPFLDAADALIEIEDSLEDEPPVPRASALKKYLEMVQARVGSLKGQKVLNTTEEIALNSPPTSSPPPDIFVWHPNLLLDKALRCQNSPCDGHYKSNGWNKDPVARRVIDLDRSFYLMSPRYKCARCRETVNAHDRKILDAIPARLRVEFPALLRHRTALRLLGDERCLRWVMGWHRRRHERMELQYVDAMAHRRDRALTIPQLEQAAMDVESGEEELEYQEDFESNGEVEVMDMEVAKELIRTVELAQRRMTKAGALDGATAHRSEPLMPGTQDYPAEVSSGVISPVEEIGQKCRGENSTHSTPSSSTNNTEFISESVEAGEAATMIDDMQHPPALSDHLPPSTVKYPVIAPKPDTPPYSFLNRIVRVQASEPAKQSTTPSGSPAPSLRPLLPRSTPSSTTSSFVDHFPLTKTYTTSNFPGNPAVFHGNPIPDSMAISDPTIPTPQLTYHIPIAPNPVPQQLAPTPSPTESSAHLNLPTYSSEPYSPSKRRGRRSRAKLIHPPPNTYETLFGRTDPPAVSSLHPTPPPLSPFFATCPAEVSAAAGETGCETGEGETGDGKGLLEGLPDEPCGCEEGKGCPGKNLKKTGKTGLFAELEFLRYQYSMKEAHTEMPLSVR